MIKVKVQLKNYLILHDEAVINLTPTAFKLYAFLSKAENKKGVSFYSIEKIRTLKNEYGEAIVSSNRNTIIKAFKEIKKKGFAKIQTRKGKSSIVELFIKDRLNFIDYIKSQKTSSIESDTSGSIKSDTSGSIESDTVTKPKINKYQPNQKEKGLVGLERLDKNKYRINDFKRFLEKEILKNKNIRDIKAYSNKLIEKYKKDFRITNDKVYIPKDKNDFRDEIKDAISDKEFDNLIKNIKNDLIKKGD